MVLVTGWRRLRRRVGLICLPIEKASFRGRTFPRPGRWTIDGFIGTVDAYIRWYKEERIKVSLGSLSPMEYRASPGITA